MKALRLQASQIALDNAGGDHLYFGIKSPASQRILSNLVECTDGSAWGRIPDCLAPYPDTGAVSAGEIVVPRGNIAEGFVHIIHKHEKKIAEFHPGVPIEAYLQNVLRHFQRIYRQRDGSLWLFRTNGMTKCAVVAPVELNGSLVYKLVTAYPIPKEPDFARRGAVKLHFT